MGSYRCAELFIIPGGWFACLPRQIRRKNPALVARYVGLHQGSLLPVFVNEVELPDQVGLESIPITQIAYIKFMPGIVIGSSFTSAGGALFIYLKKGDETDISDFVAFRKKKIKGYDLPVDFTQPDYSVAASKLKPDKRTTLFWEPYLLLNRQQNKAVIRFYNNDVSKKLLLRIEGFNEEGRLIHIERIIE